MRILIVEDEVCIAKIYAHLAMERGHTQIAWASSAATAIEYAKRSIYELIILDVQVPGGGEDLKIATLLRRMNPHAVIAVISGSLPSRLPPEAAACVDVGIAKPIRSAQVIQLLEAGEHVEAAVGQVRSLGTTWESSAAVGRQWALSMTSWNPDQELTR